MIKEKFLTTMEVVVFGGGLFVVGFAYLATRARLLRFTQRIGLYSRKTRITDVQQLQRGDHICHPTSASRIFSHHAIVKAVSESQLVSVIHLSGPPDGTYGSSGSMTIKSSTKIRMDSVDLSTFAQKRNLYRVDYDYAENVFSAEEVVQRAYSKIGEPGLGYSSYNLLRNNCEHFVTWCKTGQGFSRQSGM